MHLVVALIMSCFLAPAASQPAVEYPAHLSLARQIVDNVTPEHNRYRLGGRTVEVPPSGKGSYVVQADCTGFLLEVLGQTGYTTEGLMVLLRGGPKRKRPRAEDFVLSIEQEKGFARVERIDQVRPGDVLAHAMLKLEDQAVTQTTGHVFLIDSTPRKIFARNPFVRGTTQYEVRIIDTNDEVVGSDDSRLSRAGKTTGVGKGTIRIYTDAEGRVVGWARTFKDARFFSYDPRFPSDTKLRKAAVGRPLPG